MLRFLPDSLGEGLLRPFLMADPVAGLYLEAPAPDWRFSAFLLIMVTALVLRRRSLAVPLGWSRGLTAAGTVLLLYVWTFVSGNGRYFAWGLLLIGPLLVMACLLLPGPRRLRWGLLLTVVALQGVVFALSWTSNLWAAVRVTDTPVPLDDSPLRRQPAVFITVSNLSFSILVPQFHPQARWANISGQYNILPGTPEWERLRALLADPLPKYLVTPVRPQDQDPDGQPFDQPLLVLKSTLGRFGLDLVPGACITVPSSIAGPDWQKYAGERERFGFWVCSLREVPITPPPTPADAAVGAAYAEALDMVERRCPRFFPPGGAQASLVEGVYLRRYTSTDVRLWVHPAGVVLFQYFRSMNATQLGAVDEVRAGRFTLPCHKLPGRYLPFWQRD